jgi:hypothetical protein
MVERVEVITVDRRDQNAREAAVLLADALREDDSGAAGQA